MQENEDVAAEDSRPRTGSARRESAAIGEALAGGLPLGWAGQRLDTGWTRNRENVEILEGRAEMGRERCQNEDRVTDVGIPLLLLSYSHYSLSNDRSSMALPLHPLLASCDPIDITSTPRRRQYINALQNHEPRSILDTRTAALPHKHHPLEPLPGLSHDICHSPSAPAPARSPSSTILLGHPPSLPNKTDHQPPSAAQAVRRRCPPPIEAQREQGRAPGEARGHVQGPEGPGDRVWLPHPVRWWKVDRIRPRLRYKGSAQV